MDQGDVEGIARMLYRLAGADLDRPIWLPLLARRVLGDGCIERVDRWQIRGEGGLVRVGDRHRIFVRRHLPEERAGFVIAHELGHWACQRQGYWEDDLEDVCDRIGGALCAPWDAYRTAERALGPVALPALAEAFRTSESLVALRGGEVTGRPTCLVAPAKCRVRGDAYGWPETEQEIRKLAIRPAPGLRKVKLKDEPRRTLVAAG